MIVVLEEHPTLSKVSVIDSFDPHSIRICISQNCNDTNI